MALQEGKEVFAIGTPLADKFQFTVTRGIVSVIRTLESIDYIQSDATVLPGNSGGHWWTPAAMRWASPLPG